MIAFRIILIVLCFGNAFAQNLSTKLVKTFDLEADTFVGIDDFDNTYFIKNNIFYKKSKKGTLNYSNVSLGKITLVDIHNPFKIVLFYKEFNAVVVLDNKLNELSNKIDFTKESLFNNVLLVCHTSQNNLWLFADDNRMHLFDFQNNSEKTQTQPITFYQDNFVPISLKSTYKNVWILSKNGVIQINEYGNFINYFDLKNADFILPYKQGFIYGNKHGFNFNNGSDNYDILIEVEHFIKEIHANGTSLNIFDGIKIYQYDFL